MAKPNKPNKPENEAPKTTAPGIPDPPPTIQAAGKESETPPPPQPKLPDPVSDPAPAPEAKSGDVDNGSNAGNVSSVPPVVPTVAENVVDLMEAVSRVDPAPAAAPAAVPPTVSTDLVDPAPTDAPPDTTEEIKRGRGRPPGSKNKPKSPSSIAEAPPAPTIIPNYSLMGEVVFDMSTNALAVGLGEEWLPSSQQERMLVCGSLAKYFEAQQVKDIPPGMMLGLVVSVYALPRLSKPNTRSKIMLAWAWIKSKMGRKSVNPFKEKAA